MLHCSGRRRRRLGHQLCQPPHRLRGETYVKSEPAYVRTGSRFQLLKLLFVSPGPAGFPPCLPWSPNAHLRGQTHFQGIPEGDPGAARAGATGIDRLLTLRQSTKRAKPSICSGPTSESVFALGVSKDVVERARGEQRQQRLGRLTLHHSGGTKKA